MSIVICESRGNRNAISCEDGEIISVMQASYGRNDVEKCEYLSRTGTPRKHNMDTNCHAGNSLSIVQGKCNNKARCRLRANNRVFGDPCPGTYKYLEVKYRCIE